MDLSQLTDWQKHTLRLMVDFEYCSKTILKVQTMDARISPLDLNGPQRIVSVIFDRVKETRLLRAIILKGRRMGMSTFISGRFYQKTSFFPNKYAMQITHEPQATEFIFRMVKRFYNLSPKNIRPEILANNARLLEFNNKEGTGLNSGFRVATSGKDDIGSGQLIHYLHCSEVAKWDPNNTESLLTAVLQCVPKDGSVDTEIVYESTAKGIGGVFYDKFWGAKYRYWVSALDEKGRPILKEEINPDADPENIETSIFLPWFVFEKNRLKVPAGFVLTPEEIKLKAEYNLDDEQIYWRRFTIANECRGLEDVFNQEHPTKPMDAFLGTGDPIFDNVKLEERAKAAPEPKVRYECAISLKQWLHKEDGRLRVWKEPEPGRHYIIGADVSEGIKGGDFSVAEVIDHATGEQIAEWHGLCRPDEFAYILIALGNRYNHALLAIERNNHGLTTVTWVCNDRYPRVYVELVPEPPGPPRKRFGWQTDSRTRPMILDNLIRETQEGTDGIKSRDLLREMQRFKRQDNGRMEADEGQHDDRVMAYSIAKQVRQAVRLPATRKNPVTRNLTGPMLKKIKRSLGWT